MASFPDLIALKETHPGSYESIHKPERMGNAANIAYGGCTMAVALHAAFLSISAPAGAAQKMCLYSAQGIFLAPAKTDHRYFLSVRQLRDTKSFATRQVDVYQSLLDEGTENGHAEKSNDTQWRAVLTLLADFQAPTASSMLRYSTAPTMAYAGAEKRLPLAELQQQQVEAGTIPAGTPKIYAKLNGLMTRYFEQRPCLEGVAAQNAYGFAKSAQTTQDSRSLPEKRSADWLRHRQPLKTAAEQAAALLFLMDGGSSFIPLTHNHLFLDDTSACSTLEFALRVFVDEIDMNEQWHLREIGTVNGGAGRTYSESRIWDRNMTMVASMTSQCILRAKI